MYAVQIEVVGTCNLRCPSCPVGNAEGGRRSGSIGGTMPLDRFRQALDWAAAGLNRAPSEVSVCLYSWGEPFIHPDLPALIAEVKRRGYGAAISSNLNHVRDLEAVLRAGVDEITVSLSGFTQDAYGQSHVGGDIETVKRHMMELSQAIERVGTATRVMVHYITYRHNLGTGEFAAMAAFCEELRFDFEPSLAFFAPVEKLVDMAAGQSFPKDQPILDRLVIPVDEQFRISAPAAPATACTLIEDRVDIDVDGALKLCCSSYDRRFNVAPGFADIGFDEATRRRRDSALCRDCAAHGIDRIFTRTDYAAWREHAGRIFQELGAPVRFVGNLLVCDDSPTETMLLAVVNDHLNAGRYAEAKDAFAALRERLVAKYGEAGGRCDGVMDRLERGSRRFGRDVPSDPLRVFFAEGLIASLHDRDPAQARPIFLTLREMAAMLAGDGVYSRTARVMAPLIADACASVAEPPPPSAAQPPSTQPRPAPAFLPRLLRRLRAPFGR
ncbi:radical SAM protein [Azospirillum sp. sgz302134]